MHGVDAQRSLQVAHRSTELALVRMPLLKRVSNPKPDETSTRCNNKQTSPPSPTPSPRLQCAASNERLEVVLVDRERLAVAEHRVLRLVVLEQGYAALHALFFAFCRSYNRFVVKLLGELRK